MDIDALLFQVDNGNFAVRIHAIQHAVKEGFTKEDMIYVVLHGSFWRSTQNVRGVSFMLVLPLKG